MELGYYTDLPIRQLSDTVYRIDDTKVEDVGNLPWTEVWLERVKKIDAKIVLSRNSEYVTMSFGNTLATINLKDRLVSEDTFDAHELIGNSYIAGSSLKIRFKSDFEIVRAEKVTHLHPTIWVRKGDDLIQLIYLYDIEYRDTIPLKVTDGVIEYPALSECSDEAKKSFFNDITKDDVLVSIDKAPQEYRQCGTLSLYEMDSWEKESKVWKEIAGGYTSGAFTSSKNEPFDVNPGKIKLVVTFKGENGEFTKTLLDEAVVSN